MREYQFQDYGAFFQGRIFDRAAKLKLYTVEE